MSPLKINPAGTEEVIQVYLDPVKHPIAYAAKKQELINCGMSEKEAKDYILRNPFEMELYYSIDQGLFLIESEPLELITVYNPYDGQEMINPEDINPEDED